MMSFIHIIIIVMILYIYMLSVLLQVGALKLIRRTAESQEGAYYNYIITNPELY